MCKYQPDTEENKIERAVKYGYNQCMNDTIGILNSIQENGGNTENLIEKVISGWSKEYQEILKM